MMTEKILTNRRKWIVEKIDEYLEGKITRKELQEWAFQQREREPRITLYTDNNPNDVSNILDLLCYILGEKNEAGITDEELIDQKEYLEKIEKIFRRDILPNIKNLEGYSVREKNENISFLILYSKNNERFLENIVYKEFQLIQKKKAKFEKMKKELKDFHFILNKKDELYKLKRIKKDEYKKFLLESLKNENLKEYYSVILREYHTVTRSLTMSI